ncbi:MAG: flavin reductase, partial [Candidatus Thermoplasmatota archaeon]|nr:flavin reductase [Candidatus Thermoplasmatota archaeon]
MSIDEKDSIIKFLDRCVAYANDSIERKRERGENENEIKRWEAYRDFTAYASDEVSRGDLDDWFDGNQKKFDLNSDINSLEVDKMNHQERARWLSAIISPRPLILVSTISKDGVPNLAPMSSISVVSNTPPLLGMSLSTNREGRPRDTLLNLKETGKATLAILPVNSKSFEMVDMTRKPIPRNESEWGEINALRDITEMATAPKAAIAAIETTLLECYRLPLDAVAEWVVLKVDSIIKPSSINIDEMEEIPILTQISDYTLGGIHPTSWKQKMELD